MSRKRATPPTDLKHRWYLSEWASAQGKRQADAQRDLNWNKGTTSLLWNGLQRYTQDLVEEASIWLDIEPYELLMHPDEAMALRRLRETAFQIAAEDRRAWVDAPPAAVKTGSKR